MQLRWAVPMLLLTVAVGRAQSPRPLSARATADSFFAAIRAERWSAAAAHLDRTAFARMLRDRVNAARVALPSPGFTVESLLAADSTLPRAVAEWQVAQAQRYAVSRPFHDFSDEFAGVTSFRALQALTPEEGAVRWLEAQDPSGRWRRAMAELKCPQPVPDSLRTWSPFARAVIGVAEVNDSTAYALTTVLWDEAEDADGPPPAAVRLRRRNGAWRLEPRPWLLTGMNIGWSSPQCAPE